MIREETALKKLLKALCILGCAAICLSTNACQEKSTNARQSIIAYSITAEVNTAYSALSILRLLIHLRRSLSLSIYLKALYGRMPAAILFPVWRQTGIFRKTKLFIALPCVPKLAGATETLSPQRTFCLPGSVYWIP